MDNQNNPGPCLRILFDGPPSHESGRFVECENAAGASVDAGEWSQEGDLWVLTVRALPGDEEIPKLRAAAQMAANVDVAYNDGHEAGRAELLEELDLTGCADPAAALRAAREALTSACGWLRHGADGGASEGAVEDALTRALALLTPPPPRCTSTSNGHGHTGTWTDARNVGRCLTKYTCGGPHGCGARFTIDSSD